MKHHRCSPKVRQQPIRQELLHTTLFDVESLTVLQASFETMEVIFKRQTHAAHPHLPFALETFKCVKQKVFDMLHAPGQVFQFDGNEVLIIRTCLQVYCLDLLCMKATPERSYLITMCQTVAELLPKELWPPIRLHD